MLKTYTIPIASKKISNLYDLWINNGFENENNIDINKILLSGSEKKINSIKLYTFEEINFIKSSAIIIFNNTNSFISGLGEVCTSIESRGNGYANLLCKKIVDDYFSNPRSEVIFLGTVNPVAKKIYESLGWKTISNSNVLFNSKSNYDFDKFLSEYHKSNLPKSISNGNMKFRISIIPFVLSLRSNKQIELNAKINLINTSSGCLGLYNKYASITDKNGEWFCMSDSDNRLFSTVSYLETIKKNFRVDCLIDPQNLTSTYELIQFVIEKIQSKNFNNIYVEIFIMDKLKLKLFSDLGFNEKSHSIKKIDGDELEFIKLVL